jgi:hypothetical protein
VVDGLAGLGGDTIGFAQSGLFERIVSVEEDANRFHCLRNNVAAYGLRRRVTCVRADFVRWFETRYALDAPRALVFLDAPWGGDEYLRAGAIAELYLVDRDGRRTALSELCVRMLTPGPSGASGACPGIVLKLPTNFDVAALAAHGLEVHPLAPIHRLILHVFVTKLLEKV